MGEFMVEEDVYVTVCALPSHVKGLIKETKRGTVILINEYLSDREKQRALDHELEHLRKDDLHSDKTIEEIER